MADFNDRAEGMSTDGSFREDIYKWQTSGSNTITGRLYPDLAAALFRLKRM